MAIPILVADSNREFGILIRQALEDSGRFEVSLASSVEEAVDLARDLDFRLAILDFALPDLDGEQIIKRLRSLQPGLAVIAIPVSDEVNSQDVRRLEVDGVLTKPFYLPNLPEIVGEALGRRLDFHRAPPQGPPRPDPTNDHPDHLESPAESHPNGLPQNSFGYGMAPPWLKDRVTAARYLQQLTRETAAEAALIVRHRELIASAGGIPDSQFQELTAQVADIWAEEGRSGAVARFIQLSGSAEDFMLYTTGVVAELVLSLVFGAEVPFGMIRRQAEAAARALAEQEPSGYVHEGPEVESAIASSAETPSERDSVGAGSAGMQRDFEMTQGPLAHESALDESQSRLPEDWIPRPAQPSPSAHLLDEPEAFERPQPDPGEGPPTTDAAGGTTTMPDTPDLPLDWLPMITHSRRHLPFLEDPAQPEYEARRAAPVGAESTRPPTPRTRLAPAAPPPATPQTSLGLSPGSLAAPIEPDRRLPFVVVYAPRFPEHRLAGPLIENLPQWTRRLCIAWDWKAERVEVSDDALVVHLILPPDVAPEAAAKDLADHLSNRILEAFPHLKPGFPTGRFWASAHLLVSGRTVTPSDIQGFVTQLRNAQGLGG